MSRAQSVCSTHMAESVYIVEPIDKSLVDTDASKTELDLKVQFQDHTIYLVASSNVDRDRYYASISNGYILNLSCYVDG